MDENRIITIIPAPTGLMVGLKNLDENNATFFPALCMALVEVEEYGATYQDVRPMISLGNDGILTVAANEYHDLTLNDKSCVIGGRL